MRLLRNKATSEAPAIRPWLSILAFSIPIALISPIHAHAAGAVVQGEPVSPTEASRLEPVCRLIIVDQPMVHLEQKQEQYAQLFDRPEFHLAKNATWVHHRCWAMISKQRHFAAYAPNSKLKYSPMWYTRLFHDDMNYIFKVAPSDWEYMPQMLYEDGAMFLIERNYGKASSSAIRAIGLNPKYSRAYELLADTYSQMGNKKKALETTTAGLKHDPRSKRLIRRHVELGGRPPVVEDLPAEIPAKELQEPLVETKPVVTPQPTIENKAIDTPKNSHSETSPTTQQGNKTNPYCRFCP